MAIISVCRYVGLLYQFSNRQPFVEISNLCDERVRERWWTQFTKRELHCPGSSMSSALAALHLSTLIRLGATCELLTWDVVRTGDNWNEM